MSKILLVGLSPSFNTGEKAYDFNRTFKNIPFFLDGIAMYRSGNVIFLALVCIWCLSSW